MILFEGLPDVFKGKESHLSEWLKAVAKNHSVRIKDLLYRFVDDKEITQINIKYLEHNYATDIITFGYAEGHKISGDIYIGKDTVKENAMDLGVDYQEELARVIAHGLLHMIGFDDHSDQEKAEMRREEEKCLVLRPKNLISK